MKAIRNLALAAALCVSAAASTITGQFVTATTGPVANGTITFSLNMPAVSPGSFATVPSQVSCYTDVSGNVVGLPNPLVLPVLSANYGVGSLPSGTYFVTIEYYTGATLTAVSPEQTFIMTGSGTLVVSAPALQPAGATGFKINIGTTSGGETLQATQASFTNYNQNVALISGSAPPVGNNTVCSLTFNDAMIPYPTWYKTNLLDQSGSQIAGYPQRWFLSGSTINISNGTPIFAGTTIFPTAIITAPSGQALQTINGPLQVLGTFEAKNIAGCRQVDGVGFTTILAAATDLGSAKGAICVTASNTVSSNLVLGSNVELIYYPGAVSTIATGVTFTINGPFQSGLYQDFAYTGTGKVVFGSTAKVEAFHDEWWGSVPDYASGVGTEDGPAIQNMFNAVYDGATIVFSPGCRLDSATPLSYTANLNIRGSGIPANAGNCTSAPFGSAVVWTGGNSVILDVTVAPSTPHTGTIRDFGIINNGSATYGILFECNTCEQYVENVEVYAHTALGNAGISTKPGANTQFIRMNNVTVRSDDNVLNAIPVGIDLRNANAATYIDNPYISDAQIGIRVGKTGDPLPATNVYISGGKIEMTHHSCLAGSMGIDLQLAQNVSIQGTFFDVNSGTDGLIGTIEVANGYSFRDIGVNGNGGICAAATRAFKFTSNSSDGGLFEGSWLNTIGPGAGDQFNLWDLSAGVFPYFDISTQSYRNHGDTQALHLTLTANSATPNVSSGNVFVTANTNPTTITDLHTSDGIGGTSGHQKGGKRILIIVNDSNTSIDCTSGTGNIGCNGNAVATFPSGAEIFCTESMGNTARFWYCDTSGQTVTGTGAVAHATGPTFGGATSMAATGRFKLSDQGTCTMAAGTCTAQNLGSTYSVAPLCGVTWTGGGALAGNVKVASNTTTVTPSSSNGADTAVVNWFCFGN